MDIKRPSSPVGVSSASSLSGEPADSFKKTMRSENPSQSSEVFEAKRDENPAELNFQDFMENQRTPPDHELEALCYIKYLFLNETDALRNKSTVTDDSASEYSESVLDSSSSLLAPLGQSIAPEHMPGIKSLFPLIRKLIFDFVPMVIFFTTYATAGPYIATTIGMGIAILQIIYLRVRHRPINTLLLVNMALLGLSGGGAIFFGNELFLKCKPVVMDFLLAGGLLVSKYFWNKNLIQQIIETETEVQPVYEQTWAKLNLGFAGFFASLGIAELVVALNCSTKTWSIFEIFGGKIALGIFAIACYKWFGRQPTKSESEISEEAKNAKQVANQATDSNVHLGTSSMDSHVAPAQSFISFA